MKQALIRQKKSKQAAQCLLYEAQNNAVYTSVEECKFKEAIRGINP